MGGSGKTVKVFGIKLSETLIFFRENLYCNSEKVMI